MGNERFNVVIFFPDQTYHYERRNVAAEEAVNTALECTKRPAARLGVIARVIVTDEADCCVFEWQNGRGITFPTREQILGEDAHG